MPSKVPVSCTMQKTLVQSYSLDDPPFKGHSDFINPSDTEGTDNVKDKQDMSSWDKHRESLNIGQNARDISF